MLLYVGIGLEVTPKAALFSTPLNPIQSLEFTSPYKLNKIWATQIVMDESPMDPTSQPHV